MYIRNSSILTGAYLYICTLQAAFGYFGLAARKPILNAHIGNHPNMAENSRLEDLSASKICDMMLLQRKQRKMCRRDKGVADTLMEATNLSILECEHQFKRDRWNCSMDEKYRLSILKKGFKETSFLYAISSASLVHTFARACSRGKIDRCTCDESKNLENREAWLWGGCGDNVRFGLKFSRRFLRAGKRRSKDIRAKVDQHNIRLGRKVVRSSVTTRCKCHGISGSCTTRTCWRQLATFLTVGNILKEKYENSYKVITYTNQATGNSHNPEELILENNSGNYVTPLKHSTSGSLNKSRRARRKSKQFSNNLRGSRKNHKNRNKNSGGLTPRSNVMVHLEDSPTYCQPTRYSPGTTDRVCDHSNCDVMCCGRGYNIQTVLRKRACQCQVHWCCYVECNQCINEEEVFLCK